MLKIAYKYEDVNYCVPILIAVKAKIMSFWFPLRRILRFGKRAQKATLPLLKSFIPFVIAMCLLFLLLCLIGLFSSHEAIKEIVLLILGSYLLLFIYEVFQNERRWRDRLEQQFKNANYVKKEFLTSASNLGKILNFSDNFSDAYKDCPSFSGVFKQEASQNTSTFLEEDHTANIGNIVMEFRTIQSYCDMLTGLSLHGDLILEDDKWSDPIIELKKNAETAVIAIETHSNDFIHHLEKVFHGMDNVVRPMNVQWHLQKDNLQKKKIRDMLSAESLCNKAYSAL